MAGYKGYSMSNNAVSAYENGEKPISKWNKNNILEEIEKLIAEDELPEIITEDVKNASADVLKSCLKWVSWHHTSAKFNKTDFYTVDPDSVLRTFGYEQVMFCNTPDGEKSGMWADRKETGFGFKSFVSDDGTKYPKESVSFSRFGFIKK